MRALLLFAPLGALCLAFSSCGAMHSLKDKTTAGLDGVSKFSFRDLMPSKVPVVKARQQDLKEMPLGHERAMAFADRQQSKRGGGFFGFFRGPVDFKEPTLPNNAGVMDGSLLPPRAN